MTEITPAVDLAEAEAEVDLPEIVDRTRYDALMQVIRNRVTVRKFDPDYVVPEEHFALIIEAARHGPSGANSQPWQFIVVREAETKQKIADYFVAEQRFRAKAKMKFPTPDYRGLATAPGFIIVCSDMRWVNAFPVLNDGSDLDRIIDGRERSATPTEPPAGVRSVAWLESRLARGGALLPEGRPSAWPGSSVDVYGVPTTPGSTVSFAIRWHGARPAVLWEQTGDPVRLSAPIAAPAWSTSEASGEALWPPPPGAVPGDAPGDGAAGPEPGSFG